MRAANGLKNSRRFYDREEIMTPIKLNLQKEIMRA